MELERFLEISQRNCLLNPGQLVLVGVSGGPDSLCLLEMLVRCGFPVVVAHFDHRLRPGSQQDAESVRAAAGRLGVPYRLGSQDVGAYARQARLSIEEAARMLRYQFLFDQARRHAAQAVAVGHTADDQAETILMHLLRGAGLEGLSGMAFRAILPVWDDTIPLVRPLLPFWRADTLACCQESGLQPLFDESNHDPAFFRNRLRHELIPFLETFNPRVRPALWRLSQVLAGDAQIVQAAVTDAWADCLVKQGEGSVVLDRQALRALLPGLRHRVLRRAIAGLQPALRDVDYRLTERVDRFLASSAQTGQVDLLQGLVLRLEGGQVWITRPGWLVTPGAWPQMAGAAEQPLPVPGELALPDGWHLTAEWRVGDAWGAFQAARQPGGASDWEAWLDGGALAGSLVVRCPRPGDRFQPLGLDGHSLKLSDFWINQKLPQAVRAAWPLVASGDRIVWVPGFRPAHPARLQEGTQKALYLRLFRD